MVFGMRTFYLVIHEDYFDSDGIFNGIKHRGVLRR